MDVKIILLAFASFFAFVAIPVQAVGNPNESRNELSAATSSSASNSNENKVFLKCEEFTSGTVTGRWIVKNTEDYAVKFTYKFTASGSNQTVLVLGKQGELISNFVGYCRDSVKPIFVSYEKY